MMNNLDSKKVYSGTPKTLLAMLLCLSVMGCNPSGGDKQILSLVSDVFLDLPCADAGVANPGTTFDCVLTDDKNPFANVATGEFDQNNPDAPIGKFVLFSGINPGPTGAKARFYLWATALARRPSGENQWYTARALFELFTLSGDPLIRDQALKAYRSVLDNFFDSTTVFVFETFASTPTEIVEATVPQLLRHYVGAELFDGIPELGNVSLFPNDGPDVLWADRFEAISEMNDWFYKYSPPLEPVTIRPSTLFDPLNPTCAIPSTLFCDANGFPLFPGGAPIVVGDPDYVIPTIDPFLFPGVVEAFIPG